MTQQEFNQLLKRYLEGQTNEREDQLLREWYEAPANQAELHLPEVQKRDIQKRMWHGISKQISPTVSRRVVRLAWLSGIAASLLLGLVWLYTFSENTPDSLVASLGREQTGIEVKNTQASEQEVTLPDGTIVLLTPSSSLVYDEAFNKVRREVFLKGEAFFKVERDINRPFVVHSGELVTEVLGTSFRVKQDETGKTEVSVRTGKVSVYAQNRHQSSERNGVIITPNQRVVYDAKTRNITTGIVEVPVAIVPEVEKNTALLFRETSFEHVLAELTRLYGIEFILSNPAVKNCHITADLNGLSMFTQLELVCKSIDATYEKRGTVVFIDGNGCQ